MSMVLRNLGLEDVMVSRSSSICGSCTNLGDLRGINSLIVPKLVQLLVQLPQIEELLETITSSKPRFLSTMDILAAFYQVNLDPESRDLTTFTGPDGRRWRYTRCAMGLNNSPAQLNLILSNIFCDKSRFHLSLIHI